MKKENLLCKTTCLVSTTTQTASLKSMPVRKNLIGIFVLSMLLCMSQFATAQITAGFELDGNANAVGQNPPDDWDLIFNGTSAAESTTGIVTDLPSHNDNAFFMGSKDVNDVTTWHWQLFSTPDKDDILHGGAALYGNNIYFFGDRYAQNGDAEMGFWLFKNHVAPLADGTFSGTHAIGDILILSNFLYGGGTPVIKAYRWVGSGGSDGALDSIHVNGIDLFAIVNHSPSQSPWPYTPKFGPSGIFPKGAFLEGGLNAATLLGGDICFSSFLLTTRASASLTAELKDFIGGVFPISPQITVNSPTICPNGSANLTATITGGEAPFTFLWSTGATTATITVSPTATTVYTVTVTGGNGCATTASATVTIASALPCSIGNLNPANLFCNTGNYTISSLSSAATYSWTMTVDGSPPGWAIVGPSNTQTITFSSGFCGSPGFQVHFTLTVTDANNCTNTCTASFAPGAPQCVVDIRPPVDMNCTTTSQYLLVTYNTDFVNPIFMWTRNSVAIGAGINDTINGLDSILITQSGTYRFSIVNPFNSADSCFGEVVVNLNNTPPGVTATGDSITCQDSTAQLGASSSTAGVTFSWSGPNSFSSSLQNPTVNTAGTYTVTATNPANGCTSTATAVVIQNITPISCSIINSDSSVCVGGSSTLTASGGTSFLWSTGATTASITVNPTSTTTYTVTVTNASGCSGVCTTTVAVTPAPICAIVCAIPPLCPGDSVSLTATGGISFLWSTGATTATAVVTPNVTTSYTVTVTDANGCTSSCSFTVTVTPAPVCNITSSNPSICVGGSSTLTASGGTSFLWSNAATTASITVNPTSTTTYTVTVTNANGCSSSCSTTVTVNPAPTCSITPSNPSICIGGSSTLTASGGTSFLWSNAATTASITVTPTSTTTYTVTVTNANGCSSSCSTTVTVNPAPTCSITPSNPSICIGGSSTLTASGGTSFLWSNAATTASITVNPSVTTTYTVTVTNANGCSSSCSTTVTVNPAPTCSITPSNPSICVGGSSTLTASGGTSFLWSNAATTASITVNPSVTTTYTVTVTNANGCTSSCSTTVTVNPGPTCSIAVSDSSFCVGGSSTLTASGGTSFLWSNAATTAAITVNPTSTTTYTVTVTDANGCTSSCSATVTVTPGPTCVICPPQTICAGGSATLTSAGGVSFLWSTGATTPVITVTPTTTTVYTVTVTDANGCTSSCSTTVTVTPGPTCSINSSNPSICVGGSSTLTASGGVSFLWSNAATTASITVNPTSTTTYTVTVTDANGCTSSCSTTVTINPAPVCNITPSNPSICVGGSATLTATGGTSFLWSNAATTASIAVNPTSTTTYTVTVTDANGCTSSCSVTVTINPAPVCNIAVSDSLCPGDSATLTASGGTSFLWSNAATTASITVSPASTTTYTVTVTNANGCTSSCSAAVVVNALPPCSIDSINPGNVLCNTGNYTIGTSLSASQFSFSWALTVDGNPPGWAIVGSNTLQTITFSSGDCGAPGFQIHFTLTVTDLATGCTNTCSASFAPGAPQCIVDIQPPLDLNCLTTSQYLLANYNTDFPNPIFMWTRNNVQLGAGINDTINNLDSLLITQGGTYRFSVTNPFNLNDSCFAEVIVNQDITPPGVTATGDTITCADSTAQLHANSSTASVTFSWTGPNSFTSTQQNPVVTVAGTYTVTVTNPANGCTSSATATVIFNIVPISCSITNSDSSVCIGGSSTLTASGGTSFLWSTGATTASITVNPTSTTTYTVTVTDANGCSGVCTTTVTVSPAPTCAIVCVVPPLCPGDTVTLTASGGITFLWSTGATTSQVSIAPTVTSTYTVTVTDANGCTSSCSFTVTVTPAPVCNITISDSSICIGGSATLTASGGTSFLWSTGDSTAAITVNPSSTTTYTVTVSNAIGCTSSCSATVNVTPPPTCNITPSNPSICVGGSSTLTATGGTSFLWSNAATTASITVNPTSTTTYTVTVTDANGCTSSCSTTVTVNPLPACNIAGADSICPNTSNIYTGPANMDSYSWSVSGNATISGSSTNATVTVNAGAACGPYTITLTVTDNGCTSTCSATFHVTDTQAPVFTFCPADSTLGCNPSGVPAAGNATATDNCGSPNITNALGAVNTVGCASTQNRTYTATDACGNSSTCVQHFSWTTDTQAPVFTFCPADSTLGCNPSGVPAAGNATATDNCGSPNITNALGSVNTVGCASTQNRTYTATDACGNSSTCVQHFSWTTDTQAPVFTFCPADSTLGCNPSGVPAAGNATATDNCGSPNITNALGSVNTVGCASTQNRTYTATDACGNSSTCVQHFSWTTDTQAPVFTFCPADSTLGCNPSGVPAAGNATATDNCGSPNITNALGSVNTVGCASTQNRTYTATDACGNSSTCVQHFSWTTDTQAPVFTFCPADSALGCNPSGVPAAGNATATDNCGSPNITNSLGSVSTVGCASTQNRTYTAIDACGNSSTCVQHFSWTTDTQAPVFTFCPADSALGCNPSGVPAAGNATATDNCGSPNITNALGSVNTVGCASTQNRTYTATDACGNSSTCVQHFGWTTDTQAPVFTFCPADSTLGCNPSGVPAAGNATATDNCGSPNITNALGAVNTVGCASTQNRTYTATDACGNSSTCVQHFSWTTDTQAPVFTFCPADSTLGCNPSGVPAAGNATATDNCGSPNITNSLGSVSTVGCASTQNRTYTATDACGNSSTCVQHFSWTTDTQAPVFTFCPADSALGCNPSGVPAAGNATATDNCGSPNITNALGAVNTVGCASTQNRTYTATDACGNSSTCVQHFGWTTDTQAPVFTFCPADSTLGCNPSGVPAAGNATATDNCGSPNITNALGSVNTVGCASTQNRTYTATDACGNSSTCVQHFSWTTDTQAPVFTFCPADSALGCNPSGVPAAGNATATDNCGSPNITNALGSVSTVGCSSTQNRTYTATDACGNSSTCVQHFSWTTDTQAPVFTFCPADSTLGCNPSGVPAAGNATATDNCGSPNITNSLGSVITNNCTSTQTRTYTATDACGNTSTCAQHFTWTTDSVAPVFTSCPPGADLGCNPSSVPGPGNATATDNCGTPTITNSLGSVIASGCTRVQNRTYTATDACGNTTSCTEVFTWTVDTVPPVFTFCPADSTLGCNPASVPAAGNATATDACGNPNITSSLGAVNTTNCTSTQVRTYTATDSCGNSATCSQTFTWTTDTIPPGIVCPPDTVVGGCDSIVTFFITAVDNCPGPVTVTSVPASGDTFPVGNTTVNITAVDACGNIATHSFVVTVTPLPVCNIVNSNPSICTGGSSTLTASGGTSFLWSTSATTASITVNPTVTTTYTVTVTDSLGCSSSCTTTVTINPAPVCNIAGPDSVCVGGSATLTASGGTSFLWSNAATTASITVNPSVTTSYTVTVTNANGCTSSCSTTLTISPPPPCAIDSNVTPANLICNAGNYTISTPLSSSQFSFSWAMTVDGNPAGWAIVGSNTLQTITFSAGNCGAPGFLVHFTLTVTDNATGCTSTCTASFAPGAPICIVDIQPPVELNCITTSQYLLASYQTDIVNPVFDWTLNTVSIGPGINDNVGLDSILITQPGTYRFTVHDTINAANNCFAEVIVTADTTPPVCNITNSNPSFCSGGSSTLTASGGSSFLWSTGATTASITVNPSATTTYTVTVTDANNGCTSSCAATVTVNPPPTCAIVCVIPPLCPGDSVTLTASGGITFLWSTGATTSQVTVAPTVTTTYTVTVTDANGCTSSCSFTVTVTPAPVCNITVSNSSICVGGSSTLTASGGASFLWSTGDTTASITVNPTVTTTYTVTVTNSVGCRSSCTATVNVSNITTCNITPSNPSVCSNGSATLTASGGTSFLWSTGATTASITVNPSVTTTYTVTVTNANNCSSSCSVTVTVTPGPTCTICPPQTICTGGSATLTSAGGVSFLWSTGATTPLITVSPTTTTVYTVTVTDANGCTSSCSTTVTVVPPPPCAIDSSTTPANLICNNGNYTVGTSLSSSQYSFSWSMTVDGNPAGWAIVGSNTLQTITFSAGDCGVPGFQVHFTLTVTDLVTGCTSTCNASFAPGAAACIVDIQPPVPFDCNLTSQYLLVSYQTDFNNPVFMWTLNNAPLGPGINDIVNGLDSILITQPGTYRFTITNSANAADSCFAEVVVTQIGNSPTCSITPSTSNICSGAPVTLTASGGASFLWSTGATTASITVTPTVTTTYTVTVSNGNCSSTCSATVVVNPGPAPVCAICPPVTICPGDSHILTAGGGVAFLWSTGATTSSITVSPIVTTVYTVTVTGANGCTSSCSTTVTVVNASSCNITSSNSSTCSGDPTTLTASGGSFFLWSTGATTASITVNPSVTTTYTVTVSSGNCSSTCSTTVTVGSPPPCSIGALSPSNLLCNSGNYTITTPLSASQFSFSWAITVDGNPAGWAIVGSNTLQTITFSSGNCGAPGFEVHFTLTVTDTATGCTSTCTLSVAPGAPICIVDIRPPLMLNCDSASQYLLATYQTDIVNPIFMWTLNSSSLGGGINDTINGLDSILISLPGTYRFTITDPLDSTNICFAEVVVDQNNNVPSCSIDLPSTPPDCESSGNTLSATINSTDPVTFVWSSSNPTWIITSANNVNPITFTAGLGSTTWMLIVTNTVSGCSDTCMVNDSCASPLSQFLGCTLGFWKNHPGIWNQTSDPISACLATAIAAQGAPYSGDGTTISSFRTTFGLSAAQMTAAGLNPTLTLRQALQLGGGGFQKLARQGVASLLNTCAFPPNFPYTTAQVLTDMHNAIANNTPEPQAGLFASANEAQPEGCPPAGAAAPQSGGNRIGDDRSDDGLVDMNAYPNPFNHITNIEFTLSYSSHATLELYSPTGALVKVLFDGTTQADVTYSFEFDGEIYPPGIYIYKLQFGGNIYYERLTLIK